MAFNEKKDFDDVWIRDILIGLLVMINENFFIKSNQNKFKIPFYLQMSNDERWMQDFFTDYKNCSGLSHHTDGNSDIVPRGIIQMSGLSLDSGNLTNNFVRGNFIQETDEGYLEYCSAEVYYLPFTMNISVEIKCNDLLESYKIFQAVIKRFYKSQVFDTTHQGFYLQSKVKFPEDYTLDSQFDFDWDDKEQLKLEYDLEVECYMPIINDDTIMKMGERMEYLKVNFYSFEKRLENLISCIEIPNQENDI